MTDNIIQPPIWLPDSTRFLHDKVCNQIAKLLSKKNWLIDKENTGINVKFKNNIIYENAYQYIDNIYFKFELHNIMYEGQISFGMGGGIFWGSGANTIHIPRIKFTIFGDNSGPVLDYYVGNDWNKEKQEFWYGYNSEFKKDGKQKKHIRYIGSYEKDKYILYKSHVNPYLVPTPESYGDYQPDEEKDEPKYFETRDINTIIIRYLTIVYRYINLL